MIKTKTVLTLSLEEEDKEEIKKYSKEILETAFANGYISIKDFVNNTSDLIYHLSFIPFIQEIKDKSKTAEVFNYQQFNSDVKEFVSTLTIDTKSIIIPNAIIADNIKSCNTENLVKYLIDIYGSKIKTDILTFLQN